MREGEVVSPGLEISEVKKNVNRKDWSWWKTATVEIFAGSAAGMAQALAGHPLDTVKVRLQTQEGLIPKYNGMVHCFALTLKEEGLSGIFAGLQSPLLGAIVHNAIQFLGYEQTKQLIAKTTKHGDANRLNPLQSFLAGSLVGAIGAIADTPAELLKCQLQVPGTKFSSIWDAASQIRTQRGVHGWFQGFVPTLSRNMPAYGTYFGVYEFTRTQLNKTSDFSSWKILLSGGFAGLACWTIAYPIDTIKSIIQTQHFDPVKRKYKGTIDATVQLAKQQGIKGFYNGFLPCIYRSFISNAVCFWAYERARSIYS
eukprot:TRINITY_DN15458_c0_g1_i1.p1 TRINITY_DN15458_c0_g1~~TRINITY_DN15458_c0_g1_i1.p1  ORF type:complete len:312 (-),score=76.22 TRINITY_DN15458_c0_g1_i1:5-940(-)